jgi:hypothetical protein
MEQVSHNRKSSLLSLNPPRVRLLLFTSFNVSVVLIAGIGFCLAESSPYFRVVQYLYEVPDECFCYFFETLSTPPSNPAAHGVLLLAQLCCPMCVSHCYTSELENDWFGKAVPKYNFYECTQVSNTGSFVAIFSDSQSF